MERFLVHWKVFLKQIGNFNVICSFGSLDESKYFFEMCERKYKQPSFITDGHNTGYNWNKAVLARWKEGNQVSVLNIFINNYRQGLLASCSFLPSAKGSVRAREREGGLLESRTKIYVQKMEVVICGILWKATYFKEVSGLFIP